MTFPFALMAYLFIAHMLNAPDQALGAALLAGGVTSLVGWFCVGLVKDTADVLYASTKKQETGEERRFSSCLNMTNRVRTMGRRHVNELHLSYCEMRGRRGAFISTPPFHGIPTALALSPDCTRLTVGNYDGNVNLWDIGASGPPSNGNANAVTVLALSRALAAAREGPTLEHLIHLPKTLLWDGVPIWHCQDKEQHYFAALFSQDKSPVPVLWIPRQIPVTVVGTGTTTYQPF
ncbi:hypothetical protein M378DRAFT_18906 [Amanita muscaria Koide BX008]|uniref:Uncharacterized protein n=1 Tax=Amanita muscaria (strain Koide BX008) TaxID=946122 RepID=A0A0C2SKG8_AMAMK|nr:hypothetical protein M378DRAFT_18906 [Amanita muscaria Koide BX008]